MILKRKQNKLTHILFLTPHMNKELVQEPPESTGAHLSARKTSHLFTHFLYFNHSKTIPEFPHKALCGPGELKPAQEKNKLINK